MGLTVIWNRPDLLLSADGFGRTAKKRPANQSKKDLFRLENGAGPFFIAAVRAVFRLLLPYLRDFQM